MRRTKLTRRDAELIGKVNRILKVGSAAQKRKLDKAVTEINGRITRNHVLFLLRTKLPRLLVEDSALSRVHINVDVGDIRTGSEVLAYYGSVSMGVTRMVTIMETRKVTLAFLYNSTIRLTGPPSRTSENVRGVLDQLLTGFAAAWYRDNPSK